MEFTGVDTTNQERTFPCPDCEHRSKTKQTLKIHMLTHARDAPFQCNLCSLRTKSKNNLKARIKRHTGETSYNHKCGECEKCFVYPCQLDLHVRTAHRAERPFPCPKCDYRGKTKCYLRAHMTVHAEERGPRRFKCHLCGFKFKRSGELDAHIKLHTGESAVTCPCCGKKLFSPKALSNHINSVHGARVRSHPCNKCNFKAMYPSILKIHMAVRSVERPFKCNFCDYAAKWESTLLKHMQLHTGEKHYVCNLCPFASFQRGPLSRHQKIVHQRCSYTGARLDLLNEHWRRKHSEKYLKKKRYETAGKDSKASLLVKQQLENKFEEVSLLNCSEEGTNLIRTKSYKCRQCACSFNQNNIALALHYTLEHSLPKIILDKLL